MRTSPAGGALPQTGEAARLAKLQREAVDMPVVAKPSGEQLKSVVNDRRRREGAARHGHDPAVVERGVNEHAGDRDDAAPVVQVTPGGVGHAEHAGPAQRELANGAGRQQKEDAAHGRDEEGDGDDRVDGEVELRSFHGGPSFVVVCVDHLRWSIRA